MATTCGPYLRESASLGVCSLAMSFGTLSTTSGPSQPRVDPLNHKQTLSTTSSLSKPAYSVLLVPTAATYGNPDQPT